MDAMSKPNNQVAASSKQTSSSLAKGGESAHVESISVSTITDAYHKLMEYGLSASQINAQLRTGKLDLANPDARIPSNCLPKIWDMLIDASGKNEIGLVVASEVKLERLSIVAQAFMQSETLEQGIQQYIRFHRLVNESVKVSMDVSSTHAQINFEFAEAGWHRSEVERTVLSAVARARLVAGEHLNPKALHFAFDAPEYAALYSEMFGVPVHFGESGHRIVFSSKLLQQRRPESNPYLLRVLTQHAEKLLSRIQAKEDLLSKTQELIRRQISNESLDVEMAAKQLNMSRHTLYRKLKAKNTSFQNLLDEVKHEQSKKLLVDDQVSISEVAFLTGFSEVSAFSRAFKRWTGTSPAQYRKKLPN